MTTVFYPTKFQDNAAISLIEHHGVTITHQYDVRGPQHDDFYDLVTAELDGEECDFNTVEDAIRWIDEQLDCLPRCFREDHDEHRLRIWELV